jgi:hypothetical protein
LDFRRAQLLEHASQLLTTLFDQRLLDADILWACQRVAQCFGAGLGAGLDFLGAVGDAFVHAEFENFFE